MTDRIAFPGLEGVAKAVLTGWADRRPAQITGVDIKTDDNRSTRPDMLAARADARLERL